MFSPSNLSAKTGRDYSIDFLRGTAILFMIITHVNALFYAEDAGVLDRFTFWGATICFTVFLFCFSYVYGLKFSSSNFVLDKKKEIKRALKLLGAYYLTAFFAQIFLPVKFRFPQDVFNILVFRIVPEYTEFIIAFFLFVLLVIVFYKQLRVLGGGIKGDSSIVSGKINKFRGSKDKLRRLFYSTPLIKKPYIFLLASFAVYLLAVQLNNFDFGNNYLNDIKGLLIGNKDWHRFPILIYLPIFSLGLVWGSMTKKIKYEVKRKRSLILFVVFSLILAILIVTGWSTWHRWPPSIRYLLYGVSYCFGLVFSYYYFSKISLLDRFFIFLGQNALSFFIWNVIVLIGVSWLIDYDKFNQIETFALNIGFIVLLSVIVMGQKRVFRYRSFGSK